MPVTVSCPRCGAVYSVSEAQLGQPFWCKCGQSVAVAGPPPAVGPGQPGQSAAPFGTEPVPWTRKFTLGLRAVRVVALIALVAWLIGSQVKQAIHPRHQPAVSPPAGTAAPPGAEAPPPVEMPWPSGSTPAPPSPAQPPPAGGAPGAQITAGLVMGEPLLPKGTQAKALNVTRAAGNSEAVVVEFVWPREPTEADRDRCFAVVSVGDAQLDITAMSLQGMAGPWPARRGSRDAQIPGPQGVRAASNMEWSVKESAEAAKERRCRVTVSLRNPAGTPPALSGSGRSVDVWVGLYDFGTMPPAPLSEPLKAQLALP